MRSFFQREQACQRLAQIPGIGMLTATALVAKVGDGAEFCSGRHLAAYLGLVPKRYSSGGRNVLCGISKRGDRYLRKMMIHGARSLCRTNVLESERTPKKLKRLLKNQKHVNVAAVAMANTNARIAWALLTRQIDYDPSHSRVPSESCHATA